MVTERHIKYIQILTMFTVQKEIGNHYHFHLQTTKQLTHRLTLSERAPPTYAYFRMVFKVIKRKHQQRQSIETIEPFDLIKERKWIRKRRNLNVIRFTILWPAFRIFF